MIRPHASTPSDTTLPCLLQVFETGVEGGLAFTSEMPEEIMAHHYVVEDENLCHLRLNAGSEDHCRHHPALKNVPEGGRNVLYQGLSVHYQYQYMTK